MGLNIREIWQKKKNVHEVCLLIEQHREWSDLELLGGYDGTGKTGQAVCPRATLTCWELSHSSARLLIPGEGYSEKNQKRDWKILKGEI